MDVNDFNFSAMFITPEVQHRVQISFPRRFLVDLVAMLIEELTSEEYDKLYEQGIV